MSREEDRQHGRDGAPWVGFGLTAIVAFAAYVATIDPRPSWDVLRYATQARTGTPGVLAIAHHPLGPLLAYGVLEVGRRLGFASDALQIFQASNAACAALGLGVLYALLRAVGATAGLAAATAAGLGASFAVWGEATDGGAYGAAILALVVGAGPLLVGVRPTWRSAVAAGVASAVAVLGHQLNGVLVPLALVLLLRAGSMRAARTYLAALVLSLGSAYALLWYTCGWGRGWRGFSIWLLEYAHHGFHVPTRIFTLDLVRGLANGFVPLPGEWGFEPATLARVLVWSGLGALALTALGAARTRRDAGPILIALAATLAALFAAWWEPHSRKFWVPAVVLLWLAIGVGLAPVGKAGRVVGCIAAALVLLNLSTMAGRIGAGEDPLARVASDIAAATSAGDMVIVGTDRLGPALAYYGDRPRATNLFALSLQARGLHRSRADHFERLIRRAKSSGSRLFVSSDALDVTTERAAVEPLPAELHSLFRGATLRPHLRYVVGGRARTLYEIVPAFDDKTP